MLRAKRLVEALLRDEPVIVRLPSVDNVRTLIAELERTGISASQVGARQVDVRVTRQKLGMTQEQFALKFGFDIDAVQNWEQGRRSLDRAIMSYLRVIDRYPQAAARAQRDDPVRSNGVAMSFTVTSTSLPVPAHMIVASSFIATSSFSERKAGTIFAEGPVWAATAAVIANVAR
jgi:putative transcriptional regulator